MVLLLVFMQLTRDLFAIAKFLFYDSVPLNIFGADEDTHLKYGRQIVFGKCWTTEAILAHRRVRSVVRSVPDS